MQIILSHPTGNANLRAAAQGLLEANLLKVFFTTVASFPGTLFDKLGFIECLSEIHRRRYDPSLQTYTKTFPYFELGRLSASKAGLHQLIKSETSIFSIDSVYKSLDKEVALYLRHTSRSAAINAIYAYEDGAEFSFIEAKRFGVQCLYELPTGYWRAAQRLLELEKEKWPEWVTTMSGFHDSRQKLLRKDHELKLADRIIVASSFTAKTLQEYPSQLAPISIIPYGFPPVNSSRVFSTAKINNQIKLLFVGKLTQQKGLANLIEAVEVLKRHVTLTIVGTKGSNECPALNQALAKHTWIPSLPHNEILKTMQGHDVLVFPSLFDGFGLVVSEAMSQGTPVIATERSAGPDLIEHGKNGWLVKAGSTIDLIKTIESIIQNPSSIAANGKAAMESARTRPWSVYKKELAEAVKINL